MEEAYKKLVEEIEKYAKAIMETYEEFGFTYEEMFPMNQLRIVEVNGKRYIVKAEFKLMDEKENK